MQIRNTFYPRRRRRNYDHEEYDSPLIPLMPRQTTQRQYSATGTQDNEQRFSFI